MQVHGTEFIALHGRASSAILELAAGEAPLWRYWGPRLAGYARPQGPIRDGRARPSFSLDHDQPLSAFPTFGVGWFGQSALIAHRDGRDFAQAFTETQVHWIEPERRVELTLIDPVARLSVRVCLAMDPASDVLTLSSRLTNDGPDDLEVQWLAAAVLPLPPVASHVGYVSGRHNGEFQPCEDRLGRALWRRENRRGITSHDAFPGAIVREAGATQDAGLVYGAQLAWSGNHAQMIEWLDDDRFQWQLGEGFAPGEVRLPPGASLVTPQVLATVSGAGRNGVAQNFHAAIRARMVWPGGAMRPRPTHLNTWEGVYFDHDEATMKALATTAADLGLERFVLDDGWFHRRDNDTRALGDWRPDSRKYPRGLAPLAAHVTALGLEFGLWVEPEMVNPDSDLYRAHPDWALRIEGRPPLTARNQLVLDVGRPEVAEYLFSQLAALLESLPIHYLKWDHNRDLTTAGGPDSRARYRTQTLAFYALLERIRVAFPEVEIESCAGGGGRIDAGVLRYAHRVWTSDCIDAVSRVAIQRGFLQFMPPEIMGAHVGAAPAHSTGRSQTLAFRAAVALPGHFGVELDAGALSAADRTELSGWIALQKSLRDRLHAGQVWLGDAGDNLLWQAHGQAADLILLVHRMAPSTLRHTPSVRLPMLDGTRRYRIRRIDPPGPGSGASAATANFAALKGDGLVVDGAWLCASGLTAPLMKAESCAIFTVTAL